MIPQVKKFEQFAWFTCAVTILVIVWGAVVRATGSGAGCGNHWPLCDGEVVPLAGGYTTYIEFFHRLSSGLAFVLALGLFLWSRRLYGPRSRVRTAARFAMIFMVGEAAIGAGLVLAELVADNQSLTRAVVIGVHLVNTYLLLGALTLTAWFSRSSIVAEESITLRHRIPIVLGAVVLLGLGATGALAALSDTLFPSESFAAGFAADFAGDSPLMVRLRIAHPILAMFGCAYLLWLALRFEEGGWVRRWFTFVLLLQVGIGVVNVLLNAPLWMQLLHLLVSDVLWMLFVVYAWMLSHGNMPGSSCAETTA